MDTGQLVEDSDSCRAIMLESASTPAPKAPQRLLAPKAPQRLLAMFERGKKETTSDGLTFQISHQAISCITCINIKVSLSQV